MDVDVADPAQALADKELDDWRRMVPPCLVTVQGQDAHLLGARGRRRPGPARGRARGRDLAAARPGRPLGRAARRRRHPGRRGDVRGAGRPAARLPHAARQLGRQQGDRHADRHAGLARAPGRRGRRPELGVRGPALQRPVRGLVGRRRPARPRHAGHLVGGPRCRLRPGQPAARRRAAAAARAVAVPPVEPALLQPALPPGRGHPGVRRAATGRRAMLDRSGRRCRPGSSDSAIDRDAVVVGQAAALAHGARRRRGARSAARAFAEFRAREGDALLQFATWSVLAEDHGNDARDWPEELRDMDSQAVADEAVRHVGRIGFAMWLQWVLDEQLRAGPGQGRRRRHAARHDARPRGRRAPRRRGRVADARRLRGRRPGRRAAGPLQPARPELEPAAVAPGPARRARVRAVPRPDRRRPAARRRRPGRPRHRAVPAVVDPRGRAGGPGHLRALRPRGAGRRAGARGAPGRRRRGRRGPRRRRAGGARLPARARHPRHLDPVVRARRRRTAARRALARVVPGLGHHPRPAAVGGLPGRRPRPAPAPARAAPGRSRRRSSPPRPPSGRPGSRRYAAAPASPRTPTSTRRSWRCTATWR